MTLALAVYCLIISAVYATLYVVSSETAGALLILFVALLAVPAIVHDALFVKRRRRRRTDQ